MKQETYNKIRHLVIRENPNINFDEQNYDNLWDVINQKGDHVFGKISIIESRIASQLFSRPIRLSDIIIAVKGKYGVSQGLFSETEIRKWYYQIIEEYHYDLYSDNLLNQSDELGNFLLLLLEEK